MRVLQITHGFPPDLIAGTELYCETLSRHLLARGYEVMVLAGSGRSAQEATLATIDQDGLLVTRYLRAEGRPRRWTEEYDPEADGLARWLLGLARPDIVHLHHWRHLTNNLVAICADQRIPAVVTLHDVWTSCPRIHRIRWDGQFCVDPPATAPCVTCAERGPWQGEEEILRALALRCELIGLELALAAAIIVPSEAHRAFLLDLLDLPEDRLTVLPHGSIPTVTMRKGRGEGVGLVDRPLRVGHWGYLVYPKGTHLVLEAVRQLRDPSSVEVHLIGTSPEQEYEERLRELAQGISVRFHGAFRPADLEAIDLDVAVFPSIASESYSFTLDEALRLGLPVLVSDRGALPERIGAAGRTFQAGDAGDLADRLQEILDSPEVLETMRKGIRPEALFSMEAHVAMLEKTYKDAAHTRRPKTKSSTPYVKLLAHARQQVSEREAALAGLEATLAEARAQEQEARRAAEAMRAELEAERGRLHTELARVAEERAADAEAHGPAEAMRAELETERARLHTELARIAEERAADAQARQAAEARSAELDARLAAAEAAAVAIVQERETERARLHTELARIAEERAADAQARQAAEAERLTLADQLASLEKARLSQVQDLERKIAALVETRDDLNRRLTELERTPAARLQALLGRWGRPKGATP